jgi:hypothetical protein
VTQFMPEKYDCPSRNLILCDGIEIFQEVMLFLLALGKLTDGWRSRGNGWFVCRQFGPVVSNLFDFFSFSRNG